MCIDKTKIDPSFPDAQFHIDGYKKGGGKSVFVREGIIAKRMKELDVKTFEIICIKFTFSKKKWLIVFAYRVSRNTNKHTFFDELSVSLDHITNTNENFIVTGDLNIDRLDDSMDTNRYLSDFCDTCFKAVSGTSVDVMLTSRPRCFQKTTIIETGLSDQRKLIVSFFRRQFARFPAKKIEYRNYKKFDSKSKFFMSLIKSY